MISVIIPCYNHGAYVQEAIYSVNAQTYANWEIIIVDDGSDDKITIPILKEIKQNKLSIYFQENKGVSAARNLGASHAKGEYLLFLDGDDKIASEYFELAMDAFNANQKLSYVYCDLQEFGKTQNYRILESLDLKKTLIHNQAHYCAIFKLSLWNIIKGYDAGFIKGWEDWDLIIRILKIGVDFYKIPKAMLLYRISNDSRDKSAVQFHSKTLLNQIYLKHIDSYLKYFDEPISIIRNHETQQKQILELQQQTNNIYNTFSYRIGSFVLMPFKLIKKYFFK